MNTELIQHILNNDFKIVGTVNGTANFNKIDLKTGNMYHLHFNRDRSTIVNKTIKNVAMAEIPLFNGYIETVEDFNNLTRLLRI